MPTDTTPRPHTPALQRRVTKKRHLLALALTATLAVGASACGDDTASANAELPASVCDGFTALSTLDAQAPREPAELPQFAKDTALPVVRSITAGLPHDLHAQGQTIEQAFVMLSTTGDFEAVMNPAVDKADIGARLYADCDGKSVTVEAVDYGFSGLPKTLKPGAVNIRFENTGKEEHEMLVLRRNDGVTDSLEDLAKDPEAMMGKAEMLGVVFGAPDDVRYSRFELDKGTYFFLCLIPTQGDEADPHLNHGMHQTVTVS